MENYIESEEVGVASVLTYRPQTPKWALTSKFGVQCALFDIQKPFRGLGQIKNVVEVIRNKNQTLIPIAVTSSICTVLPFQASKVSSNTFSCSFIFLSCTVNNKSFT
jgi:hypothetical protein